MPGPASGWFLRWFNSAPRLSPGLDTSERVYLTSQLVVRRGRGEGRGRGVHRCRHGGVLDPGGRAPAWAVPRGGHSAPEEGVVRPHTTDSDGAPGPCTGSEPGGSHAGSLRQVRWPGMQGAPGALQRAAAGIPAMRAGECPQAGPGCRSPLFPVLAGQLLMELEPNHTELPKTAVSPADHHQALEAQQDGRGPLYR